MIKYNIYEGGNIVTLYDYLLNDFGYNEPFFSSEIEFEKYSKPWIYKELNKLCVENKILKYEKGVYYIPKQTAIGSSILNPARVIEKKYIKSREKVFGYYSGQTILNKIGLSTQMPNITEIYTNNESAKVRDINVGRQKVRLRRSRTNITEDNAAILCFLEIMNSLPGSDVGEQEKAILSCYIKENKIRRKDITAYAPMFPDKAMRTMIESEVIYSVTQ